MTKQQMVRHIAERVMGWRVMEEFHSSGAIQFMSKERGIVWCGHPNGSYVNVFNPLESIADAFEAQAKLPMQLQPIFALHLDRNMPISGRLETSAHRMFAIANAKPGQRCNALIWATGGNPDE